MIKLANRKRSNKPNVRNRRNIYTTLFLGIILWGCKPEKPNSLVGQTFEPSLLIEDFEVFIGSLEDFHPSLTWYISKNRITLLIDSVRATLDTPMTDIAFSTRLASITSSIRCGHTSVMLSSRSNEHFWDNQKFFPLELKFIKGRAYCFQNYGDKSLLIRPSDEILKINGVSVDSLIQLSNKKHSGDGFVKTKKLRTLEKYFINFYALHIGQPDSFNIEYIDNQGNYQAEIHPALEIGQITAQRYPNHNDAINDNLNLRFADKSSTALLTISSFNDWQGLTTEVSFEKELKKSFIRIDSSEVSNLIIDLRNNGGGDDNLGLNLFSYFYNKPIVEFNEMKFSFDDSKFYKFSDMNPFFYWFLTTVLGDTERINDSTFLIHGLETLEPYPPSQPQFNGGVYVLINGRSFSTTADFAALMKSYGLATFIGEETGGGYYGNSSWLPINIELPNTKIRVKIPSVRYTTNVKPLVPFGRGVIPDHQIIPPIIDQINGIDTEMNFTLQMIKENE